MDTVNFTKARDNLSSVLDGVSENANYTIIKRRQKPDAVVMSLEYFNGMVETMHLLSSPANAEHLMRGIAAHKADLTESHDLIDA